MGADLIVAMVEIEKGKKPRWKAAEALLKKLTDEECNDIVLAVEQCDEAADLLHKNAARTRIDQAFRACLFAWTGTSQNRTLVYLRGAKTHILLAGDTSWGEEVKSVTDIAYFDTSGLAHAAGFLCGPRKPLTTNLIRARRKKP